MRFRIKSGQSARRFVFDRTPAPAKPPQPSAPRAADLDNPYGRYRPQPRGPAEEPISTFCSLCPAHCTAGQREFCFLFLSFYAGVI